MIPRTNSVRANDGRGDLPREGLQSRPTCLCPSPCPKNAPAQHTRGDLRALDAPTAAGTYLADHLLVTANPAGTIDLRDALRHAVGDLSERQRLVLQLRYVEELTQGEIGERIGVSQMQVSRILRTIVQLLRGLLLDDDVHQVHDSAA